MHNATTTTHLVREELTLSQLKDRCPSVFAKRQSAKMGEHYTFVPSLTVVEALAKMGLVPVEASQRRSQEAATARHLVRFARKADLLRKSVGEVIPEVVLSNSHNGRAAYKLFAGMFRFVCSNGLIVGETVTTLARRHTGDIKEIMAETEEVLSHMGEILGVVTRMRAKVLTAPQRMAFANDALALRYADPETGKVKAAPITPDALLVPRRKEDESGDLWHTFNVVQENLLQGGLEGRSAAGRVIHTRQVQDVRKVLTFNTDLWGLAAKLAA